MKNYAKIWHDMPIMDRVKNFPDLEPVDCGAQWYELGGKERAIIIGTIDSGTIKL